jgi:Putative mono-oxygenase ydhR
MFTLTMRFTLPEDTDWSKIPALMEDRARNIYSNMPGLISKAFVYDPETREYGGNYVWERREQIDAFLKSDIVTGARARFGEPTYRVHQVAAYLDRGRVVVPAAAPTS